MLRSLLTAALLCEALGGCAAQTPRSMPSAAPTPAPTTEPEEIMTATSTTATTTAMRHARGRTDVKSYQPTVFDEEAGGPSLKDVRLTETFSGDVEGEGVAHVVQATRADGSASFAGIERVRGGVGGKKGTFLLQVRGTVAGKKMRAEWFVVAGSGTGELRGLRGDGGFEAELGKNGRIWLDYAFE